MEVETIIAPKSHTTQARSLAKTVSWRAVASIDTFLLGWIVTGSMVFAGSIASLEVLTKMLLYYGHERLWARILWGVVHDAPSARVASESDKS
ncbi:MAG: DUF2061 domain-containing protein [Micropepsaceae bacterium]